jgi:hypothetical protein
MKNSRYNQGNSKVGIGAILALAVAGFIGLTITNKIESERDLRNYSELPTTNVFARVGQGIQSLTGEYVDTRNYDCNIRFQEFARDNCLDSGLLEMNVPYKVHYDPKYVAAKEKKTCFK